MRNAQLAQWNYILVAGEAEMNDGLVDVRTRDNVRHGKIRVDEVAAMLEKERPPPAEMQERFYSKAFDPAAFFKDVKSAVATQSKAAAQSANDPQAKLAEIEESLATSGCQWLSGANAPSALDAEAFKDVKDCRPEPEVMPNAYSWWCMVSKFTPEKQAAWK